MLARNRILPSWKGQWLPRYRAVWVSPVRAFAKPQLFERSCLCGVRQQGRTLT